MLCLRYPELIAGMNLHIAVLETIADGGYLLRIWL
jgi:hypothetical protein